jgi:hypothetical protein
MSFLTDTFTTFGRAPELVRFLLCLRLLNLSTAGQAGSLFKTKGN